MRTREQLFEFEAEVHRLIVAAGVSVADFFSRFPSMKDAKWTIAHTGIPAQSWFDECVKPHIDRMKRPAPASYSEGVERIKDDYAERIVAVLTRIKETLEAAGHKVEGPWDMTADDYRWSILIDGDVDITLNIAESLEYDGTEDGINFSLSITGHGGQILGGLTPFNYTRDVWVSVTDQDAIESRFGIMEDADPADILELV